MAFSMVDGSAAAAAAKQPALSEHSDFRLYLRDVYEHRRQTEGTGLRAYSYSMFSAAADIKSPSYLKLIIEGRRNLSEDMMGRFAHALRLGREETVEFRALARYGQATDPSERNQRLKELSDLRARRDLESGEIDARMWDKVPSWIGWVLYAMADQTGVDFDPKALQRLFRAKASLPDIAESLRKLLEAGDLERDPVTGAVRKPRQQMEAPQDLPAALIRKLQAELIYLGIESLFRDSPKEREFGAITLALTQEEFEHVRLEVRQLRKRLHRDIGVKRQTVKAERVYQLNIQLFPVTEKA